MSRVILPGCVVFAAISCWGAASNPPVRLAISAEKQSVLVGESFAVTVELRDAYNMAARATRIYKVAVEMRSGATVAQTMTAAISPPDARTRVVFTARREGVWMIKALNYELREDSTYVRVRRGVALRRQPAAVRMVRAAWWRDPISLLRAAYQEQAPPPAPRGPLKIDLYYSDQGGKVIANGRDPVKITAFPSDTPNSDIKVLMHNTGGVLTPNPLVIPSGADSAEAQLTSEQPGTTTVQVVGVVPRNVAHVSLGQSKSVEFYIPIKELALNVSPPSVPLGNSVKVKFRLLDLNGGVVRAPDDRDVQLSMKSGLGAFDKELIPVKAGEDAWETQFTPSWFGAVEFSASTFGATVRDGVESVKLRTLNVTFPWPYLLLYFLPAFLASLLKGQYDGKPWKESLLGAALSGLTALFVIGAIQMGLVRFWDPKAATNIVASVCALALGVGLGLVKPPKFDLSAPAKP